MDLREIGIDGAIWIQLAQDSVQWRTCVNTVINLQFPWRKQDIFDKLSDNQLFKFYPAPWSEWGSEWVSKWDYYEVRLKNERRNSGYHIMKDFMVYTDHIILLGQSNQDGWDGLDMQVGGGRQRPHLEF
jgi:hypothetical protein